MTQEPQVPAGPGPAVDCERLGWRALPARALELFLALPRRVQYALAVALLGGGARLSGADAAVLSLLFPPAPSVAPAAPGRCSGREPAGVDEELRDMEVLER